MLGGAWLAIGVAMASGQPRVPQGTKEFMREKLEHAQKILEGIAMEDYDLIIAKSKKLTAMSQAASWQVFENPDYVQQSANFRRNVEALRKAAKEKNLDGVTLAYFRVTMSCVDCHQVVRGKKIAQLNWAYGAGFQMSSR